MAEQQTPVNKGQSVEDVDAAKGPVSSSTVEAADPKKANILWTPMRDKNGKLIPVGEKVTQEQVDVSDEDWEYLVESGAIRDREYPKDVPQGVSPVTHLQREAARLARGEF